MRGFTNKPEYGDTAPYMDLRQSDLSADWEEFVLGPGNPRSCTYLVEWDASLATRPQVTLYDMSSTSFATFPTTWPYTLNPKPYTLVMGSLREGVLSGVYNPITPNSA